MVTDKQRSAVLSCNQFGHYVVHPENEEKVFVYPRWEQVVEKFFIKEKVQKNITEGEPKIFRKMQMAPNEEMCVLFCISCGEPMQFPKDSDWYPSICSNKCKFEGGF